MDPQSYAQLKQEITRSIAADRVILDQLRAEIRPLCGQVHRIHPRTTTSISLVATDGGNNSLRFDPFLVQIVRVVDSNDNEYYLDAITPTTSVSSLSKRQFWEDGSPRTPLGELMAYLDVWNLQELSHHIHEHEPGRVVDPGWVKAYRELVEWAILFSIVRKKDFGTDTLIVYDGLLRSVVFAGDLFQKYIAGLQEGIKLQKQKNRRKIYLVGVAKHSQVLSRYRLAMALERILTTGYPAYLAIPGTIEEKAYSWTAYTSGERGDKEQSGLSRYVGGKMFFVKFGNRPRDPIWPVDILLSQVDAASHIFGCLLADALNGFPVPLYPRCLQKAHENAALADFDFDVLQSYIFDGLRQVLAQESSVLDTFRLQEADPSRRRYE
ncbi:MAG TPA: hypothetical protein VJ761_17480 [Ktedonobacteraceae bacterium]|nr:hypothetical protein [Ktedonobacteraceae bacterium]